MKIYINGIEDASNGQTGSFTSNSTFYMSKFDGEDRYLDGSLDEVRIWTEARTEAEIRQNMYREILDPSDASLVAYYPCNSDLDDASSNSNNGTFNGGTASYTTSPAFFGPKKCLNFNGSPDYIYLSSLLLGATNATIEAWVYLPDANRMGTIARAGKTNWGYGIGVGGTEFGNNGNKLIVLIDGVRWIVTENIGTGWHHVAFSVGASNQVNIYLDGRNVYTETSYGSAANAPSTCSTIGASAGVGITRHFSGGKIDEVRYWSEERSASNIRENMCKTLTGNETNLVAYYNFDNTSGTSLQNISENAYDGTLYNMSDADWVSSAAFNTWLNTDDDSWSETTNWSDGAEPTSTDNVGIPNSGGSQPTITTALDCNNLVVGSGATLTFNYSGSHTIHGNAFVIGTTNLEANTDLTITGSLFLLHNSVFNIKALADLTVDKNLYTTILGLDGTLTLESTATGTGSLIVNGTATGSVVQERYIAAATWGTWDDGWHLVASPVPTYDIEESNFTPETNYDFYAWSEPDNEWINFKDGTDPTFVFVNTSDDFELGHGYLVAYEVESTKDFTGSINVADITISNMDITGSMSNRSWHLLGNPFNSALTWFTGWTTTTISGTAKIWNEGNRSYTTLSGGDPIPATNGFMVQATADDASLTIPEAKRVHNSQAFYKNSRADYPIVKLKANNMDNPSAQESELRFNPESTNEWDMEFDSDFLAGYAPYFYSIVEGVPQSVNSMPNLSQATTIHFTFIKNEGVNFCIEMYEVENMVMDVWLLDKKLNNNHNLSQNPVYLFTAFEQDDPERFVIQFAPVGINEEASIKSNIQTWAANNTIHILNPENRKGEIRILNLFGQQVAQARLTGDTKQQIQLNVPTGCYLVNVMSEERVVTRKVIVK